MAQQLWTVNSLGGYFGNAKLSKDLRIAAQPMMRVRQFCDADGAVGKNRNDTFLFDKITNITTAGGTIPETSTIPKRNFKIRQGSLTVVEYGNGIPYTQKFENLSEINVPNAIKVTLRNDMAKVLDSDGAAAQFKTTKWKAVCSATDSTVFATNGTATKTAANNMSDKNVRDIIDELKKKNVPKRKNEYVSIASTLSLRGLYDYFEAKAYTGGNLQPIYNGEVGNYYSCRFIEETNVLSNTVNSSYGEALFFGADAVREGIVIPEEIRMDIARDFGRDRAIAWYYLGGFKKVWDYSSDNESRIIHVTTG